MWSVVLKILSILGIILLVLLGIALTAVLLVLFMPVVYRGSGSAHADEYRASFRFRWLFGLVRGEFTYPEGGALRIKALWMTLYDSSGKKPDSGQVSKSVTETRAESVKTSDAAENSQNVEKAAGAAEASQDVKKAADAAEASQDVEKTSDVAEASQEVKESAADAAETSSDKAGKADGTEASQDAAKPSQSGAEEQEPAEGLFAKLSALKKKLQPYLEIVRDEDNQALVRHVLGRLGRILKSIRPRVLRIEALIGLGEPDTTGYVYGACWAVKPFLGRKCCIIITPDFEQKILEGEIFLRGHITGVVLLHHIIRVILDKRLWQLIDRLKNIQE